ncbi:hypothetical protein JCM5350_000656 [Sporobolomyces pararoseus]
MKVIALLSGGKDSIYNLHHCILNDHEPVCVASLGPPEGQDELDSFMYQTVAHSGLETLAQALDLPFYSTSIKGKPLNQSSEYGSRSHVEQDDTIRGREGPEEEEDETEDLYRLLKLVKTEMPQVEAVASGAILSNYQRVRVEHVCSRLGLASIAYLWQRNQKELLNEMVLSRQQSVLVKVAGAGLGVQHLGKTLAEMQPILHKLNQRYETHVCGEGGEYETFTLDSPIFKKRLVLDETKTVISNPDPHSTVAHLFLSKLSLVDKPDYPAGETFKELQNRLRNSIELPCILDEESEEIKMKVQQVWQEEDSQLPVSIEGLEVRDEPSTKNGEEIRRPPTATVIDDWLSFSSISAFAETSPERDDISIEEELTRCFEQLKTLLSTYSTSLLSLSHLNLLLSHDSMILFPRINKIYSTYFGSSPPTRACVSVRFPDNDRSRIKLEGVARLGDLSSTGRTALHVQSLSYWGAANIGPYSQAITTGNRCYIAGQIPLIPRSLQLPHPSNFPLEVALSLQHVRRIVEAAPEGRWKGWTEGGVGWMAEESSGSAVRWKDRVKAAREGWRFSSGQHEEGEHPPPIVFVSAAQLPRSASIEWQLTWQTGQAPWSPNDDEYDDTSDEEAVSSRPRKLRKIETQTSEIIKSSTSGQSTTWQCSPVRSLATSVVGILGCSIHETNRPASLNKLGALHSIKAFYKPQLLISDVEQLARRLLQSSPSTELPTITFIGSNSIDTLEGCESHDVAFVVVAKVLEE